MIVFVKTVPWIALATVFCLTTVSNSAFGQFPGDQQRQQLVRLEENVQFINGNQASTTFGTFSVPANKMLVVEYAAAEVLQPSNPVQFEGPSFTLEAGQAASQKNFIFPLTVVDPAGWRAEAALRTKLVFEPNENINAIFSNFAQIPSGIFHVTIEGYLVPAVQHVE